jgi:hypothetical protein
VCVFLDKDIAYFSQGLTKADDMTKADDIPLLGDTAHQNEYRFINVLP